MAKKYSFWPYHIQLLLTTYGIRRKDKAFEVAGVSDELVKKFSRRRAYIDKVAAKLGIDSGAGRDTLGASTRLGKTKNLADDLGGYWLSRMTTAEKRSLTKLIGQLSYVSNEREAVQFAIGHMFERSSVVDERRFYEAATDLRIERVKASGEDADEYGDCSARFRASVAATAKVCPAYRPMRGHAWVRGQRACGMPSILDGHRASG